MTLVFRSGLGEGRKYALFIIFEKVFGGALTFGRSMESFEDRPRGSYFGGIDGLRIL